MSDGTDRGTPVSQTTLDDRYNTPAITDVRGAFNIDGNTLHVTADFMSFANMSDVKAFVTVNEKVIEKNGANGESEFRHILLTMLGGDQYKNTMFIQLILKCKYKIKKILILEETEKGTNEKNTRKPNK